MSVFTSRRFWVSVFVLLAMLIMPYVPGFKLDAVNAAGFLVIVIAYLIGITKDPGPGGWAGVLQSRKFWAALIGFIFLILNGFGVLLPSGLGQDQILVIVVTLAGYISAVAFGVEPPPPFEDDVPTAPHNPELPD